MNPSVIALLIILAIVGLGSLIGFRAGAHQTMNLEQWAVASRGFGLVLVWLLMAGEAYTTFSFLGASGWAYSRGGPALYILTAVQDNGSSAVWPLERKALGQGGSVN